MRRALPIAAFVCSVCAASADVPTVSLKVINEVQTVRWQLGRLDDDTPHWQIIAFPEVQFSDRFAVGMMGYTDTRLSDRRDATLRRAFYENDVFPYVRWSQELWEGWKLHTRPQMGFSYIDHWKGPAKGTATFFGDFRWTETLETPYLTSFVYFRKIYDPDNRMNGHIGLSRAFALPWQDLELTPNMLLFFGNAEENAKRFGLDPKWNGENRHHSGFSTIMPGITLSKKLNEYLSCFVSFRELVVANHEYRRTLAKKKRPVNYREHAIFSVGIVACF